MFLLLLVLTAAAPVKLASPGLTYLGVEPAFADALADRFATQLSAQGGLKVTTRSDVAQVLGLERQRALAGCPDSSSCLAELAAAMGADALLIGSLVKAGGGFTVTLRMVRASNGAEIASATHRMESERELQDWLDVQAGVLGGQLRAAFGLEVPAGNLEVRATPGPAAWPWVTGGASVAVLVAGGVTFALGKADARELSTTSDPERIRELTRSGPVKQPLGVGLMVAGGVGLAASILFRALDHGGGPRLTLIPSSGGLSVGVGGALP